MKLTDKYNWVNTEYSLSMNMMNIGIKSVTSVSGIKEIKKQWLELVKQHLISLYCVFPHSSEVSFL